MKKISRAKAKNNIVGTITLVAIFGAFVCWENHLCVPFIACIVWLTLFYISNIDWEDFF